MKKNLGVLFSVLCLTLAFPLAGCSKDTSKTISVCASELPHAKILSEAIKPILEKDGYTLTVKVLDWTIQNDAVANGEYDANYFQHVPYLKTYEGTTKLYPACKVHYEKLCLYAKDTGKKTLVDGSKIEIVNDVSNIERALNLLVTKKVLTINSSCYDKDGNFTTFDTTAPNTQVTFLAGYTSCTLTCIKEAQLCQSLDDYDFGIIPGNTAMTGLGSDYASRIVFGEEPSATLISQKANIIAVKEANKATAKTKELVKACADPSVSAYITATFGESVLYHFEDGLTADLLS
jgi:D-methionine transport system substrate-binding protein